MDGTNFYIEYNSEKIEFKIEKSKRKSICIIVKEDGDVVVRAPMRVSNRQILEFVQSKNKWICQKKLEQKRKFKVISFNQNDELKVLGKSYILDINFHNKRTSNVTIVNDRIVITIPNNLQDTEKKQILEKAYDKYILNIAKKEIPETIDKIANMVGLFPKELKIRNFKRAWGNCSNKRIISINKNICKFSKSAIEYVCLHEICHLKYMNHSKDFWNMVEKYMPNYKKIEKEMK